MLDLLPQMILGALLGACLGSYFGCAWWRIPRGISMMGQSRCPSCGTPVPGYLNLPVLSSLILRGRSRCCGQPLSKKYLIAEVGSLVVGALVGLVVPTLWVGGALVALAIVVPLLLGVVMGRGDTSD